jgi:signal transduction histidine kinase
LLWLEPTALDDVLELGSTLGVHLTDVMHRHASGEPRPVEIYLSPMPGGRLHGIVHDMAARALAEARSRELHAERLARALTQQAADEWGATFEAIPQPIFVMDGPDRVTRGNGAAASLMGVELPIPAGARLEGSEDESFWQELRAVIQGRSRARQVRQANGRTWSASAVATGDGTRVILVLQELTALIALQDEVQRRETLARMGELVAGVAHEVRNPLFAISSLLDAARQRLGSHPDFARVAPMLDAQVQRLSDLMRDLLDYGRPAALERRETTVAELLHAAHIALRPLALAAGVELRWNDGIAPVVLMVDRVRFCQVLVNLGANAIQHAPKGGVVEVTAARTGAQVEVTVTDNGPGFPPDLLPHAFEPFVTRRPGGTGLGLALAHRIAFLHGATIQVGNRVDANGVVRGAVATLRVPDTSIVPTS